MLPKCSISNHILSVHMDTFLSLQTEKLSSCPLKCVCVIEIQQAWFISAWLMMIAIEFMKCILLILLFICNSRHRCAHFFSLAFFRVTIQKKDSDLAVLILLWNSITWHSIPLIAIYLNSFLQSVKTNGFSSKWINCSFESFKLKRVPILGFLRMFPTNNVKQT